MGIHGSLQYGVCNFFRKISRSGMAGLNFDHNLKATQYSTFLYHVLLNNPTKLGSLFTYTFIIYNYKFIHFLRIKK